MPANPLQRYLGDLPREVTVLTAVAFAVAVGFGIVFPAIPLFAKEFGVSNTAAGAVVSVFALMRFVGAAPAGWLVNRAGERMVLATGIGIVGVSSAVAGLSQNYWQLLILRGLGGLGSAMFTVSAFALLLRVVTPDQRARASGAFQGGFLIGGITGPLFGAPLLAISPRLPFFIYAGTLLAAGAIGLVYLSQSRLLEREEQAGTLEPPTPLGVALRKRAYWSAMTNNFATGWALFGLRGSLLPIFVVEGLLLSESWVGAGIFISALAQGALLIPAGHASDTRGRRPSLILGASLLAGTFLLLATVENYVVVCRGNGGVRRRLGVHRDEQQRRRRRRAEGSGRNGYRRLSDVLRPRSIQRSADRWLPCRHHVFRLGLRCHCRCVCDGCADGRTDARNPPVAHSPPGSGMNDVSRRQPLPGV